MSEKLNALSRGAFSDGVLMPIMGMTPTESDAALAALIGVRNDTTTTDHFGAERRHRPRLHALVDSDSDQIVDENFNGLGFYVG